MSKKKTTVPDHQTTDILGQLKENPKNPRTISKDKFQKLKKSILDFPKMMELRPIIYDKDKVVLGGNMRLKALRELVIEGLKVKPEYFKAASDLTKKEIKQFIVADNLPFGAWDFDLLAGDYSIDELIDFGFDEKELDLDLWQSEKTDEQLDDAPEPQKTAISKTGDIFLLGGKHRILCSDCVNGSDLEGFMGEIQANMVFTDPPYNVDYGVSKNPRHKIRKIENDKQSPSDWIAFNEILADLFKKHCVGDVYMWGASGYDGMKARCIMIEAGLHWSATIIWKKQQLILTPAKFQRMYEPCLYGWFNKSSFVGDRKNTEVWEVNRPLNSKLHPTMKPVELCVKGITLSSKPKDIVLDLFLGSGSTLIACEEAGRICYGTEIDPIYIDVIIRRYHKLYPDKPIECLTNKNFNFKKLYEEEPEKVKKGKIANE